MHMNTGLGFVLIEHWSSMFFFHMGAVDSRTQVICHINVFSWRCLLWHAIVKCKSLYKQESPSVVGETRCCG